jgi:large subunit ribosomal protein L19e
MSLQTVRRIAADVLGIGENRIKIKHGEEAKVGEALTREDVRGLLSQGLVYAVPVKGVSRALGRMHDAQKKLGRRRGHGSRKGTKYSKISKKEIWMSKVRGQRKFIKTLKDASKVDNKTYRSIYLMVKGKAFKGKAQIETYLKENKLMKE